MHCGCEGNAGPADPANTGCNLSQRFIRCGPSQIFPAYFMECGVPSMTTNETLQAAWKTCSADVAYSKVCACEVNFSLAVDCEGCACQVAKLKPGAPDSNNPGCSSPSGELKCGPCQISLSYYQDCGMPQIQPNEAPQAGCKRCAASLDCSKVCVDNYFLKHKAACTGQSDGEILIRNHFDGPTGCTVQGSLFYWMEASAIKCNA